MRHLFIAFALVSTFPLSSLAQQLCPPQNYEISEEPNFDCPGPGEADLVAPLRAPSSIPVEVGDDLEVRWPGALVHRDRLIYMGLRIKASRRLRWLDTQLSIERADIESTHRDEVAEVNATYCDQRVRHYQDQAATAREAVGRANAWYRQFWFGLTVGLVISGVLIALAAYVVTVI